MMTKLNAIIKTHGLAGILPVAVLLLVVLMVVPIPPTLLDIGFVLNIALSLAVLMIALNAAKPLDFSSFPTVLLLATIFRLALNVASTRVVLVNGHTGPGAAGHIIESFAEFLIGGDYVVGIFVFAVLMIINLVVITKGAGRVSEVSARFTLDALPGKQMAVDADLNAGLITPDEARARRQEVATEADFYGSMDGASKFVKGDAIAGILILVVNIVGGLILGVVSHGMGLGEAAKVYISLAIGDALAAQVPALLLSIAAAAIVTRVTSSHDLSGQIGRQFAEPRALWPVAGTLGLMGVLPGMPHLILLLGAAGVGGIAWQVGKARARAAAVQPPVFAPADDGLAREVQPILVEVGYALVDLIDDRRGGPLPKRLEALGKQLSAQLGFKLPAIRIADDLSLPGNAYRIAVWGVTVGEDEVRPHDLLALDGGDCLPGITGIDVRDPSFGLEAKWITPTARADAIAAGYTVVDAPTVIATHVNTMLIATAAELFGLDEAQAVVDDLKRGCPQLVASLTPQAYPLATIAALCRALLAERVPLRDFRRIAEAMVDAAPRQLSPADLLAAVRQRIGATLVQPLGPLRLPIPVVTFAPELESLLVRSAQAAPEAQWPFDPGLAERLMTALEAAVAPHVAQARSFAIVTAPACRAALARLVRARLPDVPVLAFAELPPERRVDVLAVVGEAVPAIPASLPEEPA